MSNIKLMMVIYVIAAILCAIAGITNFTQGNVSNGVLWLIASICWGTCIFNTNKNNYPKK